jgi:allophanate hydrolase
LSQTIAEIVARHGGGGRVVDTIEATYAAIEAHGDGALFISLRPRADALAAAARLDAEGPRGRSLFGVPYGVKDNIDVAGLPTTAACPAFAYTPVKSSFVVERLEAAGAIPIGKTNLDQFATGLVGVRSPYGVPRNALRADLIPGGSSSGSAVAVAAGLTPFALGTDTAGSGRVPAALGGIVGVKPSLGLLSTSGVVPACRTLDTISIFALDVADAFTALAAAAGHDAADPYSRPGPAPRLVAPPPRFRVGAPAPGQRLFFGDAEAERAFAADLERLAGLGADIVEFDIAPFLEVARLLYEGPWVAERYAAAKRLIETRPDEMLPLTRKIIEGARRFDAVAAFEATYRLAALRRTCEAAWARFEVMAVPTLPRIYTRAEVEADPIQTNSNLGTYTNFVNLLDLCAIAYPSGLRGDGLPSSVTLIARAGADGKLAAIAARAHAVSGAPLGATGRAPPPAPAIPPATDGIELAVVGAHLSGLPLNGELRALGAQFVREAETTPDYRLYALPNTTPPKPGLLRVAAGEGAAILVEIWSLTPAAFGAFVAAIPPPLGVGTLAFADGTRAKGFLVEAEGARGARDVSSFGGWRAFVAAKP